MWDKKLRNVTIFLLFIIGSRSNGYVGTPPHLHESHIIDGKQGYIVDWDAQKAVWDGLFTAGALTVRLFVSSLFK